MPPSKQPELQVRLRIVLESPPAGVDFGLQQGKGHDYDTIQIQASKGKDLVFECTLPFKDNRDDGLLNFLGPLSQGPASDRFLYIDIGELAGQQGTCWSRRMKLKLNEIERKDALQSAADPALCLEARFPGMGKDGGPSCASVRSVDGWKVVRGKRKA